MGWWLWRRAGGAGGAGGAGRTGRRGRGGKRVLVPHVGLGVITLLSCTLAMSSQPLVDLSNTTLKCRGQLELTESIHK